MYKGIIFDLDGTLLNTIDDITDSINYALEKNGLDKYAVDEVKYMVGSGVNILISKSLKEHAKNEVLFEMVYNDYMDKYEQIQRDKTSPYEGIIELLNLLKMKGIKLGVVSNKPHNDTVRIVKHFFGNDIFDLIYGKKEEFLPKPNPNSVLDMIFKLGISKNEVLYVGDSDIDMKTAINCELDCIAVLWGFRKKEELEIYKPKYIVNSPLDIYNIAIGCKY